MLNQKGLSIAVILIGMSLLGMCVYLFTTLAIRITSQRTGIWARDELTQIEDTVRGALADELGNFTERIQTSECTTVDQAGALFAATGWTSLSPQLRLEHVKSFLPAYTGPSDHDQAKDRCLNNQTFDPSGTGTLDNSKNGFYVCFGADAPTTADRERNTVFRDPPVFIEVRYVLWNFNNGTNTTDGTTLLNCSNFKTIDARGAQMYYTIYWQRKERSKTNYYRHSGLMYVRSHR